MLSAEDSLIFQPTLSQDNGYRYQLRSSTGAGGETEYPMSVLGVEHWPFISKTYGPVSLLTRQLLFYSYQF
jgi:hypothetical protein